MVTTQLINSGSHNEVLGVKHKQKKLTQMKIRNYTPHDVVLNDGRVYKSMGIARVSSTHEEVAPGMYEISYGEVVGLPEYQQGMFLIVSALVQAASDREDLIAPATGHPETIRNEKGQIISVPGFIIK